MVAAAKEMVTHSENDQPGSRATVLRSKLGRVVDLNHPIAGRVLELRAAAKQMINGPNAYRSAQFARWHKAAAELYSEFYEIGLPALFEDRFYQRSFGRMRDVLTDDQIYAAFKTDMQATIQDFQRIVVALEKNRAASRNQLGRQYGEYELQAADLFSSQGLIVAAGLLAAFLFALGLFILI